MLNTETMSKINGILKGLVNCELEFQAAQAIAEGDWSQHELSLTREKAADRPEYLRSDSGSSIGFPLFLNGEFAGLAVVNGCYGRLPEELQSLAQLLTSVMERKLLEEQRGALIAQIKAQFAEQEEDFDNVIQMRPTRLMRVRQMLADIEREESPANLRPSALLSLNVGPLLIPSQDLAQIHRQAVQAHEASGRWAMIPLEGLAPNTIESREALKELGGVTLLIADLSQLSSAEQVSLQRYLAIQPSAEMPQVIAGCLNRDAVSAELLKMFAPRTGGKMIPFHVNQHPDQPTVH